MNSEEQVQGSTPKGWTSIQAYALAATSLALGLAIGYLAKGSAVPARPPVPAVSAQAPAQEGDPHAGANVNPEQLKRMADSKAAPLLEEIKKNPSDAGKLAEVGNLYFATRQFDIAAGYFERAAAAKPDAEVLTELASAYFYGGNSDKAIASLNRALRVNPTYPDALFNLGMLKWQVQGDPKGAISLWQKLLETNPKHPLRAQVEDAIAKAKKHTQMAPEGKAMKPPM